MPIWFKISRKDSETRKAYAGNHLLSHSRSLPFTYVFKTSCQRTRYYYLTSYEAVNEPPSKLSLREQRDNLTTVLPLLLSDETISLQNFYHSFNLPFTTLLSKPVTISCSSLNYIQIIPCFQTKPTFVIFAKRYSCTFPY